MTPYLDDGDIQLYHGDAIDALRQLPAGIAQTCVTSPPYWGLRDYGTGMWTGGDDACDHATVRTAGGPPGSPKQASNGGSVAVNHADVCRCGARRTDSQLGLEARPELYVERLVAVFREVWRVLRADGTVWLNLAPSFVSSAAVRCDVPPNGTPYTAPQDDGEGCIQVHQQRKPPSTNSVDSFQCDVGVGMMTPDLVEHAHRVTGLGVCHQQNRGVWDWSVRGQQAATLLRCIYPYLIQKRGQAALTIMLADDLAARKYGRGNPAQVDVMAWRARVKQAVSDLNQRRGTDLEIREPDPVVLELKAKDDTGIPWMVAQALRADGWYLRSDIIWSKPNPMPESVVDRPTKAHEYLVLLSKQPRYFYDADAIREEYEARLQQRLTATIDQPLGCARVAAGVQQGDVQGGRNDGAGRNRRSVWTIPTQPFPEAHFATFPEALVRPCVLAGTSERGECSECGAPWVREVDREASTNGRVGGDANWHKIHSGRAGGFYDAKAETMGWRASCTCDAPTRPQTCIDPFVGSGTTALVARNHGRRCIGIDLSSSYLEIAAKRLQQLSLLSEPTT